MKQRNNEKQRQMESQAKEEETRQKLFRLSLLFPFVSMKIHCIELSFLFVLLLSCLHLIPSLASGHLHLFLFLLSLYISVYLSCLCPCLWWLFVTIKNTWSERKRVKVKSEMCWWVHLYSSNEQNILLSLTLHTHFLLSLPSFVCHLMCIFYPFSPSTFPLSLFLIVSLNRQLKSNVCMNITSKCNERKMKQQKQNFTSLRKWLLMDFNGRREREQKEWIQKKKCRKIAVKHEYVYI